VLHAPRGPFYSPKAARSRWRPILPSVEWCTGQSGAQLDIHCSSSVHDFFPFRAQSTVGPLGEMAHRTLSGAHRTVRCTQPTVGAGHVSRVDHADDRWSLALLAHRTVRCTTGQSGAPPDSPVNFSHVTIFISRER
jgi:hypothetical protein